MSERLLLDTHVWLWMFLDQDRIRGAARRRLVVSAESDELLVAAISMYEIAAAALVLCTHEDKLLRFGGRSVYKSLEV